MFKILIRADASIQIGFGHVMRCITLATELKKHGAEISFVCRNYPGNLKNFIEKQGFIVYLLPSPKQEYLQKENDPKYASWLGVSWQKDLEEIKKILPSQIIDCLIVDHYGIDFRWHKAMRVHAKKIVVIDDLADRKVDCDFLIDQTHERQTSLYNQLVPNNCKLLLGSDYAILREEFFNIRPFALEKRNKTFKINRILVCMGSMDPNNLTGQVLRALEKVKWKKKPSIDVVLVSKAPNLKEVIKLTKNNELNINILQDVENMSDLMLEADLAIGAGGTTSWERCCLGLPSLLIQLAENQQQIITELVTKGAVRHLINKDLINEVVSECNFLQHNPVAMSNLSINSFNVVDGQGTKLIAIRLRSDENMNFENVSLRNAKMSDAEVIYEWQSDPNTRKYFHNVDIPKYEDHIAWMEKKLLEPLSFFYVIEHDLKPAGVVRLDYINDSSINTFLVSIVISPKNHNKGLGSKSLNLVNLLFKKNKLFAEIHEDNIPSIKLFLKSGYKKNKKKHLYVKHIEKMG